MASEQSANAQRSIQIKSFEPQDIPSLLANEAVPKIYVNGFIIGMTNADAQAVMLRNGQPVAMLNLSFTTTKSMAQALTELVSTWENRTGSTIATSSQLDEKLKAER